MSRSAADIAALNAELKADPRSIGLVAPPTIADVENADALNLVRDTLSVDRKAIPVAELAQQVKLSEYAALSEQQRDWLKMIMQTGSIDVNDTGQVKAGLLACFPAGSSTRAGMASRMTENVNRVEEMFRQGLLEIGGYVTPSDIAAARLLG